MSEENHYNFIWNLIMHLLNTSLNVPQRL